MKKITMVLMTLAMVFGFSFTALATDQLEVMKDGVKELRVYFMSGDYVISQSDLDDMKKGHWPDDDWESSSAEWFSIPVVNREYSRDLRVPAGNYKVLVLALGGDQEYSSDIIFYGSSQSILIVENGKRTAINVGMNPVGYEIKVIVGNTELDFGQGGHGKAVYMVGAETWEEEVYFFQDWETQFFASYVFIPYGATSTILIANTTQQLKTELSWDDVVDGVFTADFQPQLQGGEVSLDVVWPENPEGTDQD